MVPSEDGLLDVWDDRRIGPGADWEAEIRAAIDAADVAILLISPEFLTSRFVRDSEIPRLLQRRAQEGVCLIPVLVRPCLWRRVPWLAALQVRPWNGKPLSALRGSHIDEELMALAEETLKLAPGPSAVPSPGPGPSPVSRERGQAGSPPSPAPKGPSWLAWARQRPVEALTAASVLVTALGTGLGVLGLVTERAREGLIGLPPLSYASSDLLLTGAQSLWSLPWRAAAALAAPHPVLQGSAFAVLLLALALLAGGLYPRRSPLALAALGGSAGALLFGAWLFAAAVHSGLNTPAPGYGLSCEGQLDGRWDVSAAFETCTWLTNDTEINDKRRQGLDGVLGLLLLAAGGAAWMGARIRGLGRRASWARWSLVAVNAALALFFLRLVPAAYAYSNWGVRYRSVAVRNDLPGCDQALAQTLKVGSCCAFDVSENATGGAVLLLWGSGCPGGTGFMSAKDVEAIGKGCLQLAKPQTINSSCP
jgi:hypothetical protein